MTAVLVFITFVSFSVVERFSNKQAARHELQAAFRAETGAAEVRSTTAPVLASIAADNETSDHRFQPRTTTRDRRRGDRRGQDDRSAA
jgi:uncharacterized membrane protein